MLIVLSVVDYEVSSININSRIRCCTDRSIIMHSRKHRSGAFRLRITPWAWGQRSTHRAEPACSCRAAEARVRADAGEGGAGAHGSTGLAVAFIWKPGTYQTLHHTENGNETLKIKYSHIEITCDTWSARML